MKYFRWALLAASLLSIGAATMITLQYNGSYLAWEHVMVESGKAKPSGHGPYAYSVHMGIDRESQNEIHQSLSQLYEDGKALTPGNARHAEIGKWGMGRFSFWKGTLYFSSSDNSDPRVNRRRYELRIPYSAKRQWVIAGWSLVALLLVIQICFARIGIIGKIAYSALIILIAVSIPYYRQIYAAIITQWYIFSFRQSHYERAGADFCNPRYDPTRIGKPLEAIDSTRDYDYAGLEKVRASLRYVDRKKALKHIFDTVTRGANSSTEKHLAVLRFLQKSSFHSPYISPRDAAGVRAAGPLQYLELGEMWCGDVSTLAIDLFAAAGYQGRLVQLGGHQVAEIYYDGGWHYLDADTSGYGEVIRMPDGRIPSIAELNQGSNWRLLDSIAAYREIAIINSCRNSYTSFPYISYYYFSNSAYDAGGNKPCYYVKRATADQERKDPTHYGWFINTTLPDPDRKLFDLKLQHTPATVAINEVDLDRDKRSVRLVYYSSDPDNDLAGYRIYISSSSRAWNYQTFYGSSEAQEFWSSNQGWKPKMYESYFKLPPHNLGLIATKSRQTEVSVPTSGTCFITIMAFDKYGESVGNKFYPASNELKIKLEPEDR
jgi:hypothetical protein